MVKKKTVRKKKRKPSRSTKKKNFRQELFKTVAGLAALVCLVVLAGYMVHRFLEGSQTVRTAQKEIVRIPVPVKKAKVHVNKDSGRGQKIIHIPRFEIFPTSEIPHHKPMVKPLPPPRRQLPKVAIIIDDLGYDRAMANNFIGLKAALTFSVLPFSRFQKNIALEANKKGFDIMLHLPMEPVEYPKIDPGPGALLTTMSPDTLIQQLNRHLDRIPFVKGVNNHMGSRLTADADRMNQIFSVLKQRGLFFIDSRTTADTRSIQAARLFKVPFAQRDVFLDHVQDKMHIQKQFEKLIHFARLHGEAVGIGHPYPETYNVLKALLPDLKKRVLLVPASQIVNVKG